MTFEDGQDPDSFRVDQIHDPIATHEYFPYVVAYRLRNATTGFR